MEHVDWIVSFVIFVFVILAVITAIPRFLPGITNQEDLYTSKMVYSSLVEKIDSYNLFTDENESYIYFLNLPLEKGRGNSSYLLSDNIAYGILNKEARFYYFDANETNTKTKIFSEKFLEDNLNYFQINQGNLITFKGDGFLTENSEIESLSNHNNFFSEFVFEPKDANVYFNYIDDNEYSLCSLKNNNLSLYDKNSSGDFLIDNINVNFDQNYWITLEITSRYSGYVNCTINNYILENNNQSAVNTGKIKIENSDDLFVSDFIIYKENNLLKDNNYIETYNFDININDNVSEVELFEERDSLGKINISFLNSLDITDINNNQPGVVKNNIEEDKIIIFPNIKETIIVNDSEIINFTLENINLNYYDYEIEFDTNYYIWIKTDILENQIKTLYLRKIDGYQVDDNFTKSYNPSTHPTVTITDLLNNYYEIEIDNTGGSNLSDYEIRISNDIIGVLTTEDSLFISDNIYDQEENLYLVNKEKNKFVSLNFFDVNNERVDCDVGLIAEGFTIDCNQKTFIKLRINDVIEQYPNIKYFKEKKQIINFEKIEPLLIENTYDSFINIYNNKQNVKIGDFGFSGDFKIFENFTLYLNDKGQEEIVKVLIKPN